MATSAPYKWTVDVETDWGGRTSGTLGLTHGLPIILDTFKRHSVKALFFISSELVKTHATIIRRIVHAGHEIGSHGHFHIDYKNEDRAIQDMEMSMAFLSQFQPGLMHYRAPKFSYQPRFAERYAHPFGHLSLLKIVNLRMKPDENTILYLHPYDIVEGNNPPNMFCKLWYGRPRKVCDKFKQLVRSWPGERRLT